MLTVETIISLYSGFQSPITVLDCGNKCAPYNEHRVPFCCDTRHAVPAAFDVEWDFLSEQTDLWHMWQGPNADEMDRLQYQKPAGQVLIECKGHLECQRQFRSFTCRAFPFFPYLDQNGYFLGMTYYGEYQDRCWVISNLAAVTSQYLAEFIITFERLFQLHPQEKDIFRHHSVMVRRIFGRKHHSIVLLHRNGFIYKITPRNGRIRRVWSERLPKYGPYKVAASLPFPDEV